MFGVRARGCNSSRAVKRAGWFSVIGPAARARRAFARDPIQLNRITLASPRLMENEGVDRFRAAVIADGQRHRHRICGPGQVGVLRRRGEGVAQGAGRRACRFTPLMTPAKVNNGPVCLKEPGGIVAEKGLTWRATAWVSGLIAGAVLLKVKLELEGEAIFCWLGLDVELEIGEEGEEGHRGRRLDKDPRRPGVGVVEGPADEGGVAVGGQRDGVALCGYGSNRAGADELRPLLGPDAAAAGKDPRRPGERVVASPADEGGVAVGGQRDGEALLGVGSNRAGADQLRRPAGSRHRRCG